jgi:hypothetical protein
MFYLFLLAVAAVGVVIYLLVILTQVPGAKEERFGVLESLPQGVGEWRTDEESAEGRAALEHGERREQRILLESSGGLLGGETLVTQVRYRSVATNEIVRTEPEKREKRKRVRV